MQSSSINDSRRMYNFGERVAELAPQQSPFFVYLSKVAKKSTDDPVFKFLEQRYQWQRRNFEVKTTNEVAAAYSSGAFAYGSGDKVLVDVLYDKYGREVSTAVQPGFLLKDQIIQVECKYASDGNSYATPVHLATFKVAAAPDLSTNADSAGLQLTFISLSKPGVGEVTPANASKIKLEADAKGQVIGSAFAEGGTDPEGWKDELYDRE